MSPPILFRLWTQTRQPGGSTLMKKHEDFTKHHKTSSTRGIYKQKLGQFGKLETWNQSIQSGENGCDTKIVSSLMTTKADKSSSGGLNKYPPTVILKRHFVHIFGSVLVVAQQKPPKSTYPFSKMSTDRIKRNQIWWSIFRTEEQPAQKCCFLWYYIKTALKWHALPNPGFPGCPIFKVANQPHWAMMFGSKQTMTPIKAKTMLLHASWDATNTKTNIREPIQYT